MTTEKTTLPYKTPMEVWLAFKAGMRFTLHYHGKVFQVTHMQPRESVVYVIHPSLPVKVLPDGSSAEGPMSKSTIWLAYAEDEC